jgi:hypothetical protein
MPPDGIGKPSSSGRIRAIPPWLEELCNVIAVAISEDAPTRRSSALPLFLTVK